jgi:elongation factor Ts
MGGKIGVAVVLDAENAELGKGLAMHIAANNPQYLSKNDIDPNAFEHEKAIQLESAKNDEKLAGKPAEMLEKIITAKVNKYFAESVLLAQPFLLDDTKTVEQVLAQNKLNILKFVRFQVGEGIEKRKDDFASEVMSQIG